MAGTVSFVVDTNLFLECHSLHATDFPWSDLGDFDMIELLVTGPVQSDLDRHKKGTKPRTRRRAAQAITWIREMLRTGTQEHVFREQGPRVVMRLTNQTASSDYPDQLDLTVDDDKIVGVAVALVKVPPPRDLRVLSDDTRPIARADAVGMQREFIPDSWLREPGADDQEKEIARLKAKIAELEATHPLLEVAAIGTVKGRLKLTREALAEMSADETASVRTQLSERFALASIEEVFAPAAAAPRRFPRSANLRYVPPSADAIKRYREETHPAWIEDCISYLDSLPSLHNKCIAPSAVTVTLDNAGYRPAEYVRISFKARGPLLIMPTSETEYAPKISDLPQIPRPPEGQWLRDGNPVASAIPATEAHDRNFFMPSPAVCAREDECWDYGPESPKEPVEYFHVDCRRFRHGAESARFEITIFPQSHDPLVQGAVEVGVSASNIGRPFVKTFPVEVVTSFKSPITDIETFLAGQDLNRLL